MGCRNPFSKQPGQISCLFGIEVTPDLWSGGLVIYMNKQHNS